MPPTNNGQQGQGPVMDVSRAPQQVQPPQSVGPSPATNGEQIPGNMLVQPPKKNSHVLAIVVAVMMAVLIICASIVLFVVTKDKPAPAPEPINNETPVDEGFVTPQTVDDVMATIEQNLNTLNDQEDFTPNDISDETLGLQSD